MPFEKPAATFGGRTWWTVVEQSEHFVLQVRSIVNLFALDLGFLGPPSAINMAWESLQVCLMTFWSS